MTTAQAPKYHVPVDDDGRNILSDDELIEIMVHSADSDEYRRIVDAQSKLRAEAIRSARAAHPAFQNRP